MKRFKGTKGMICLLILILMLVGYYYYLSNRSTNITKQKDDVELSPVQEVLLRDIDKSYPPTPKEVMKYYLGITKCLHNEEITDEELHDLAMKIQGLYDDELIANKTEDDYIADLKSEITTFKDNKYSISNYSTSVSTDVDYFTKNNYNFAKIYCTYYIRVQSSTQTLEEVFLLRKDENSHWKIYGWEPVTEQETDGSQ